MSFRHRITKRSARWLCAAAVACLVAIPQTGLGQEAVSGPSSLFATTDINELLNAPTMAVRNVSLASQPQFPPDEQGCSDFIGGQRQSCHQGHVLPSGLLFRSYIAGPHEPRMGTVALYDLSEKSWRWDSTLGGRVGLYRRDRPLRMDLDAWQIDMEGAVMVRLDPNEKMDLESSDYRFGLIWTGRKERLSYKAGYFHVSSHVGDEYLIKNPGFERVNYVRENLIVGTSFDATDEWRLYGEVAYAVSVSGGAEPWQIQFGTELARQACRPSRGAPFAALNFQMRQEVDFAAGVTAMAGWQWTGTESGHTIRTGLQYFNGPSNQYEFYERFDNQMGIGLWFDF